MRKAIINYLKKLWKTFFLILFLGLLVFGFNIFYNQEKKALASEYETKCETIIPIGTAVDYTQEMAKQIIDNLEVVLNESKNQIGQAQKMINFANQCNRNRCSTDCNKWTQTHSRTDPRTRRTSTWTTYHCAVRPCAGNACDFSGITSAQNQIKENSYKIDESQKDIEKIVKKVFQKESLENEPPTITELLTISEAGLEYCAGFVKITEGMTAEEIERLMKGRKIKMLLKCDLAKTADPGIECHSNDFYCCG